MSFPAEGVESAIKNHIEDVRLFLDAKHPGRYAVYNLSPRTYRPSRFHSRVRGRASTPQDPLRDRSAPRRGRRPAPGLPRGSDGGRGRWAVSGSSQVGRAAPHCCSPGAPRSPRERKLRDADPVTAGPVRRAGRLQALLAGAAHVPWRGAGAGARGGGAWVRSPREPGPAPQVFECGWAARRAPDLHRLYGLCRSMHAWLRQDPRNVCVVHCAVSAGPSGRRRQGARTGGRARLATVLPGGRGARLLRTGAGAGTPGGSPEAQGPPWRLQPAAPGLRVPASCDLPSSSSVDAALSGPPGPPGKATARAAAASLVGTRGDTGAPTRHSSISRWES